MGADTQTGLWLAVIGFGVYHGLNPAMGWPLAVANGLSARRGRAVFATVLPLGVGHLLAMAVALLPFAMLAWVVEWGRALRAGAGALVLLYGVYRLLDRRHPRFLARVAPSRLAWWSFLMATAHGAGLMLVPIALSLCRAPAGSQTLPNGTAGLLSHDAVMERIGSSAATMGAVAVVHTLAMVVSGVVIAWAVYRWLGVRFLRQTFFNLDAVWAISLIVAGGVGLATAVLAGS